MVDYFDANAANGTVATTDTAATINGAAAPATNGEEIGMDEISVSVTWRSNLRIANQCCSDLPNTKGRSSNDIMEEIDCQGRGCACEGMGFRNTSDLFFHLPILYYHDALKDQ